MIENAHAFFYVSSKQNSARQYIEAENVAAIS